MENYINLHKTASTLLKLGESLQSQLINIYQNEADDYCKYLNKNKSDAEFMAGLQGVQNNLNLPETQKKILGEDSGQKLRLKQVKRPMVEKGLYPKNMLGKYVFHLETTEKKKPETFEMAMVKLMRKFNVTNDEMRTKILNENFK